MTPISFTDDPALEAYAAIFKRANEGILLVDESGVINLANDVLINRLGYQAGSLSGSLIFMVNPHLTLLSWKKIWKSLLTGAALEEETELMHAQGTLLPIRSVIRRIELEERTWAMIAVEFLLETTRYPDMLRAATKAAELCTWELNLSTNTVLLEGECSKLLGFSEDRRTFPVRAFSALFADRISQIDLEKLRKSIKGLIDSGELAEAEVVLNHPGGSFDRLRITAIAHRSGSSVAKVYGTVGQALRDTSGKENSYLSRFTIDHVSDLIFWVRPDGSFAYVNQAVCDCLGYSREELLEMKAGEVAQNFKDAQREAFWDILRREKHYEAKYELVTRSGELVPILASSNYLIYEGEEFNCSVAKDITRQEAENYQLRLTQFSIEHAHEMILWLHTDGTIFYANDTFTLKTGYDTKSGKVPNFLELVADEALIKYRDNGWKELQELEEFDVETTLACKDGHRIPVYCTFNHLSYKERTFICIYLRDWRKKKRRDMQLFWAQNALASARDMIFWIDDNHKIAYTNRAAAVSLGYEEEALIGRALKEVYPKIHPSQMTAGKDTAQFEANFKMKSGKGFPVEISISAAQFKGKDYSCLIVRNIRKRKENEQQLLEKQKKIEELSLKLKDENVLLREEISSNYNFNNIITQNKQYRNVLGQIAQVADSDATVLIQGETGTGKELLARAIYSLSERDDRPFIKVNCAALPENLIESELFGHEKGAFTGAVAQKKGRFELADKGTIFLDEIGELPLDLQAKLLRVLQEGEFERLGSTTTVQVNVRIVAATNRNLEQMVEKGTFREDLYYRLNVFPISNPPLRQRREDIPLLVKHFVKKYGKKMGKEISKVSQADIRELQRYDFPGNVRELENIVERAMILAQDGVLNLKASFDLVRETAPKGKGANKFLTFEEMQRQHIVEALKKCNMRITGPKGAARILELNDRTLMSKMRKLGIKREDYL